MIQSPKSLTAVVHVRFHYNDEKINKPPSRQEMELFSQLREQASEMEPDLQEILLQFAGHLKKASSDGKRKETGEQSPD